MQIRNQNCDLVFFIQEIIIYFLDFNHIAVPFNYGDIGQTQPRNTVDTHPDLLLLCKYS